MRRLPSSAKRALRMSVLRTRTLAVPNVEQYSRLFVCQFKVAPPKANALDAIRREQFCDEAYYTSLVCSNHQSHSSPVVGLTQSKRSQIQSKAFQQLPSRAAFRLLQLLHFGPPFFLALLPCPRPSPTLRDRRRPEQLTFFVFAFPWLVQPSDRIHCILVVTE